MGGEVRLSIKVFGVRCDQSYGFRGGEIGTMLDEVWVGVPGMLRHPVLTAGRLREEGQGWDGYQDKGTNFSAHRVRMIPPPPCPRQTVA